jgi:hypothetical protein
MRSITYPGEAPFGMPVGVVPPTVQGVCPVCCCADICLSLSRASRWMKIPSIQCKGFFADVMMMI